MVVEGPRGLAAALDAGALVRDVFVGPGDDRHPVTDRLGPATLVTELSPAAMRRVADAVTPQPVLGVVEFTPAPLATLADGARGLVLVAAGVRDPGNAGTLIRSAVAAGAGAVIFCRGSVDVTAPKTVRASAGALFALPVVVGPEPEEVLDLSGRLGFQRLGAGAHGGEPYDAFDWTPPTALFVGNEAHGFPPGLAARLDATVTIPVSEPAESLNVGMAATVLLFEAQRQRRAATPKKP